MNEDIDPYNATQNDLEALFVNNPDLDCISAYLDRFNPIRVMRMQAMEIRHSAILAWLLDPTENHGFDDEFLRAFLAQSLVGSKTAALSALKVSQSDLRDAEIQREKRNMDIFIVSPSRGWAFIIENKFHSKQSERQLSKYLERAKKDATDAGQTFVHQGIFLTLHEEAANADAADQYVSLRYSDVCEILASVMTAKEGRMGAEVKQFLEHYLDIIREATDMSDDQKAMADLARQLYRSHKKALDFIMEHGVSTEFMLAAETVFHWVVKPVSHGSAVKIGGLASLSFAGFS
ncbi:MAG: PD-(D/E)XK nuclease family protein [Loktanella sp.]|nr:PD-(D/E)XK nuclease family protein [Loktanella sp.]